MLCWLVTYLQWTEIGPSWPNCSFVLCTWPMKSMKPSPDFGTPCSGQSVNWNCLTVRDCPSWETEEREEWEQALCQLFEWRNGKNSRKKNCWSWTKKAIWGFPQTVSIIIIHTFVGLQCKTSFLKKSSIGAKFKPSEKMFCYKKMWSILPVCIKHEH